MLGLVLFILFISLNFSIIVIEIRKRKRMEGTVKTLYKIILEFEIVDHGYKIDPVKWSKIGWSNESQDGTD